jgi:hypothetical protein
MDEFGGEGGYDSGAELGGDSGFDVGADVGGEDIDLSSDLGGAEDIEAAPDFEESFDLDSDLPDLPAESPDEIPDFDLSPIEEISEVPDIDQFESPDMEDLPLAEPDEIPDTDLYEQTELPEADIEEYDGDDSDLMTDGGDDFSASAPIDDISDDAADEPGEDFRESDMVEMEEGVTYDLHPEDAVDEAAPDITPEDIRADIDALNAEMEHDAAMLGEMPPETSEPADSPEPSSEAVPDITPEDIRADIDALNAEMEHDAAMLGEMPPETPEPADSPEPSSEAVPDITPEDIRADIDALNAEMEHDAAMLGETEPETLDEPEPVQELPPEDYEEIDTSDINDNKDYFEDVELATEALNGFRQNEWDVKDLEGRKEAIVQLVDYNAEVLGLENKPYIDYYNTPDATDFGVSIQDANGNPVIMINEYNLGDGPEAADTIAHEMRHAYQSERAAKGETDLDIRFRENLEDDNYIQPEEDRDGYNNQLVERDSRAYANRFKEFLNNI